MMMASETIRTHVVIPRDLVEAVDRLVGQRKRSAFLVEAIEEKLEREEFGRALAETKGFLPADAYPEWSTPEKTSAWVRELRAVDSEATDRKLSRRR
jgi:predicted transcriptional regulator